MHLRIQSRKYRPEGGGNAGRHVLKSENDIFSRQLTQQLGEGCLIIAYILTITTVSIIINCETTSIIIEKLVKEI